MANGPTYRVVVECNKRLLRLFSIIERSNDDLVIKPKSVDYYREFGTISTQRGPKIKNQKYSIHCSPNSQTGINAIKHTLEREDKTEETQLYTIALKQSDLFVPIYVARCPNLDNPKYLTDANNEMMHLGNYDPKKCVLYYMIVIGNRNHKFLTLDKSFDCRTLKFRKFSVTVFWSFSFIPSDHTGAKTHLLTFPPEKFPLEAINQANVGFTKKQIAEVFVIQRHRLQEEFINLLIAQNPQFCVDLEKVDSFSFSKKCDFS